MFSVQFDIENCHLYIDVSSIKSRDGLAIHNYLHYQAH